MYALVCRRRRFFVLANGTTTKNSFLLHSFLHLTLLLAFFNYNALCEIKKDSVNVCNKTEPQHFTTRETVPREHEVDDTSKCSFININCKKTKKILIKQTRLVTQTRLETKYFCCPGFEESLNGECLPKCSQGCGANGECIEPDVCKCYKPPIDSRPGYAGFSCKHFVCLPLNTTGESRWGQDCEKICDCKLNQYCDANDGTCLPNLFSYHNSQLITELVSPAALSLGQSRTLPDSVDPSNNAGNNYTLANFVMVGAILSLLLTLVHYRRRLNKAKVDLFQVAYSARTSSSYGPDSCCRGASSIYSAQSTYASSNLSTYMGNRARLPPLPRVPESSDNYSCDYDSIDRQKAAAQEADILANTPSPSTSSPSFSVNSKFAPTISTVKPVVNAKVEARLMANQRRTEYNIYSDVESSVYRSDTSQYFNDYIENEPTVRIEPISLETSPSSSNNAEGQCQDDGESQYQTPKALPQDLDDSSNIYEEIKSFATHQATNDKHNIDSNNDKQSNQK